MIHFFTNVLSKFTLFIYSIKNDGFTFFLIIGTSAVVILFGETMFQYGQLFIPQVYTHFNQLYNYLGEICLPNRYASYDYCWNGKDLFPVLYLIILVPLIFYFLSLKRVMQKRIVIINSVLILILWFIVSYKDIMDSYLFLVGK